MCHLHGIYQMLLFCTLFLTPSCPFRIIKTRNSLGLQFQHNAINYQYNTEPITLDGHYDDESRKWSKIQPGEIVLGDLERDIDGNYFVKTHISNKPIDIAITNIGCMGDLDNFNNFDPYYQSLPQNFINIDTTNDELADKNDISLNLDMSKDSDRVIKSTLLCCKNMVLRRPETRMSYEKFDWENTTFNPAQRIHYIHPKKLEKRQIEVLITSTDPHSDTVTGELFTHQILEQKRRDYLTVYHMLHKASSDKKHFHIKGTAKNIMENVIELKLLNNLTGYAIKRGLLKNVQIGESFNLIAVGCDPLLERVFLVPDDGEINYNYQNISSDVEKAVIGDLLSMNKWFKAEIVKFNENGLMARICGISNPVLAFIPTKHLPYCGSSGVIDNMYMRNFTSDRIFAARYIASKLGKLCHINHYDNTVFARFHQMTFSKREYLIKNFDVTNFSMGTIHLTTRPKIKWSEKMAEFANKLNKQSLEMLEKIDTDHFYPSKILFQANGHIYLSVNVNMDKNFNFEQDGIIGLVPIDEYYAIAKPGALIHARINRIESLQRKSQLLLHNTTHYESIISSSEKIGTQDTLDKIHVLFMSLQPPENVKGIQAFESNPSNFTFLPYFSENHPEVYTERTTGSAAEQGKVMDLVKEEYENELFWENREEAIRKAFTRHWFRMYQREVEMVERDPVSTIYSSLENKSGPLFRVIDAMKDFHQFRQIPLKYLLNHFEQLLVLINTSKFLPLEKIFQESMAGDNFYKIMSASLVPMKPSGLDFLTTEELEAILSMFLPQDPQSRQNFISQALKDSVRAINIAKTEGYTLLTPSIITRSNIAISILATLVNPKYGLMTLARTRHRTIPNEVFSSSRQTIHYNSRIVFDHPHEQITRVVRETGNNPMIEVKSMPPWPYLVKSTQLFYAHLTDMGLFDLARSYNKLLSTMRSDEDLINVPEDLPEDYIPAFTKLKKDGNDWCDVAMEMLPEKNKSSKKKKKERAVESPNYSKYSEEEIDHFFKQLDEIDLQYGLRIPLF